LAEIVGAAVIGLDHWYSASMVLDQIEAEEDMRLIAIADSNAEHLEEARTKYSPDSAVQDFRQILDDERIDLVFSFVPTARNGEVCLEALGRGKHVFCVKPSAMTVENASSLAAAAEDAGVFFSSFEVYHRLSQRSQYLKKIIQDGIIGEPISFYHVAHGGLPQPWAGQTGASWWLDPSLVPGGAWIDHAIYAVDQIRWTLEREVDSVSGVISNRRHKDLAMEDHGVATVRLTGGFTAVMEDTWTADAGTRFDRWIGTAGSLYPDGSGFIVDKRGELERLEPEPELKSIVAQLADAVRGTQKLPFMNTCCVHNLAACLAVYKSARTGKTVQVPAG